ncbi:MAG: flagellin [Synergistota bacterium]|nr:flagellin [Synergistota bacterium]
MRIFNNISALFAKNALGVSESDLQKSIRRLSSGLRINSAADDAAGLAISNKMRAQVTGLDQAGRNAQGGISMIQTAEGGLNESHAILQRMRELSVQAANDTLTSSDRQHIQREIDQLTDELNRIATTTQFNKKRLLDGSSSVLWSTSSTGTQVVVRGGLRTTDEFGQKAVQDGNYDIHISTMNPGQAQTLKSHVMPIWEDGQELSLRDIPGFYDNGRFIFEDPAVIELKQGDGRSAHVLLYGNDTIQEVCRKFNGAVAFDLGQASNANGDTDKFAVISSGVQGTAESIRLESRTTLPVRRIDQELVNGVPEGRTSGSIPFAAITKGSENVEIHIYDRGAPDSIQIFTREGFHVAGVYPPEVPIDFTPANGFLPGAHYQGPGPLVNPPYTNTPPYNQVTWEGATIAYSGSDNPGGGNWNEWFTVDVAPEHLLVFVTGSGAFDITATWDLIAPVHDDYTLTAPIILRSSIPGEAGKISLSGDDNLLKALGFSTVQEAEEPVRRVAVRDSHSGRTIASGVTMTGNLLSGVVHPEVDVVLEPAAGFTASWNDAGKTFALDDRDRVITVHLADNSSVLQTGANEGEDVGIIFGDMSARGLGLIPPPPSVVDRELAGRTLTRVDNAMDRVSRARARLGAYQNRLEHTVANLAVASSNLTASESRIRDLDMAREMMNFTRLSILMQSGTSMLAQANQLPQNVLELLKQ